MARVAVVGYSHVWEKGMYALLEEADLEVVSASDNEGFSDCAVVEVSEAQTLSLVSSVIESYPNLPIVAIVGDLDMLVAAHALKSGVSTVVPDGVSAVELREAIESAIASRTVLPTSIAQSLAYHVPELEDLSQWITDEQIEWLRSMASGLTITELANDVGYSERAMFRHLKSLYHRLGVNNRTEALLWAKQRGLLE